MAGFCASLFFVVIFSEDLYFLSLFLSSTPRSLPGAGAESRSRHSLFGACQTFTFCLRVFGISWFRVSLSFLRTWRNCRTVHWTPVAGLHLSRILESKMGQRKHYNCRLSVNFLSWCSVQLSWGSIEKDVSPERDSKESPVIYGRVVRPDQWLRWWIPGNAETPFLLRWADYWTSSMYTPWQSTVVEVWRARGNMPAMSENAHFAQSVWPERRENYFRVDAFANPRVEATQSPIWKPRQSSLSASLLVLTTVSPGLHDEAVEILYRLIPLKYRLIQVHWQC